MYFAIGVGWGANESDTDFAYFSGSKTVWRCTLYPASVNVPNLLKCTLLSELAGELMNPILTLPISLTLNLFGGARYTPPLYTHLISLVYLANGAGEENRVNALYLTSVYALISLSVFCYRSWLGS